MNAGQDFEIFLVTAPGFESLLCAEARERGFKAAKAVKGVGQGLVERIRTGHKRR